MRSEIVAAAREYLNTPYQHQARVKGVGVDCIGLCFAVCWDLGIEVPDFTNYSEIPAGNLLLDKIAEFCEPTDSPEPGDILVFLLEKDPQHVAILSEKDGRETMIHAYMGCSSVKEHTYSDWWKERLVQAFKFPVSK
jgi:NlpC/P60 family putative phage cell wall peptidase